MELNEIVALYVSLNLILICVLMMRVGKVRMSEKISLGDGGNAFLMGRVRAHGNFIETTPMAMIGLMTLAGLSAAPIALHIFGGLFTFGRLAHAQGMSVKEGNGTGRGIGALLTLLCFLGMAGYALYLIIVK